MNIPVIKMLTEMNIGQLNDTKAMIDSLIKSKVRNEMKVGTKVLVVQKTKIGDLKPIEGAVFHFFV